VNLNDNETTKSQQMLVEKKQF